MMTGWTFPGVVLRVWGLLVLVLVMAVASQSQAEPGAVYAETLERGTGEKAANPAPLKGAPDLSFTHTLWGQSQIGEGLIYGPGNRRSGMAVIDIEQDGDNDFVFPNDLGSPQLLRNLGSSRAFYPGGIEDLNFVGLPAGQSIDLGLDFGDVTGNGLADVVAVTYQFAPFTKRLVWFKNMGPLDKPEFAYQSLLYTSVEHINLWPTLGDIDGDGDLDIYLADALLSQSERPHRVYFLENRGTPQAPQFAAPREIPELSALLPEGIPTKALKDAVEKDGARAHEERRPILPPDKQNASIAYNLGDIALRDWDADGRRDFMFYSKTEGLYWVRNVGSPENPIWENRLGSGGAPRYDHRVQDGTIFEEGTFEVVENPEASKPGAEWLRDVFISVNSRLKTFRFLTTENRYRVIQETPVAFPAGQGQSAFWDYDQDGDLDMLRLGISSAENTNLLLFPNVGTPYNPAWGVFSSLPAVPASEGNADNFWRQDVIAMGNHDGALGPDLFVQRQNGQVNRYWATPPASSEADPTFGLADANFGDVVKPGDQPDEPRGLIFEDFDGDGFDELITIYAYPGGANIVVVDLFEDQDGVLISQTFDFADLFSAPDGGDLDPRNIENITVADLDRDGRAEIVLTLSYQDNYRECELHYYEVEEFRRIPPSTLRFSVSYGGRLEDPYETDKIHARTAAFADIDADGNDDLFVGHRYPPASSLRHYLRYYRNESPNDLFYVRFRVVSERSRALSLQLTTGGGSQVQTVFPEYRFISNPSGAQLGANAQYQAGGASPAVDILETTNLQSQYGFPGEVRVFVDVLPPVGPNESKAIIVIGDVASGSLYPTFRDLGAWAYRVLISEGLDANSIRLYADSQFDADFDGTNDVTAKPTLPGLEDSIRNWARGSERLLVYLIDHGQRKRFRMNATDYLESADYAAWLDALQAQSHTQVTTVIDTCESGSFLEDLAGDNRITMTSAGVGPVEGIALFDRDEYISFSLHFWTRLFNGDTYGQAYREAKTAIESINPLQRPQIDDDGDGVGNAANDGLLADNARPGANFVSRGPSVFIGEVAPNQAIAGNTATLWLSDVVTSFPVEGAKAIIVPPNFSQPERDNEDEQPLSNLPSILFSYNATLDRWEAPYNGFNQGGLFQIQYFVKTGGQYYASPRIGFVDRIGIPDIWENDDTPQNASWIGVNTLQGHNFHKANDEDWVRFNVPTDQPATIAVLRPGRNSDAIVELYRGDNLEAPIRIENAEDAGREVVFNVNLPEGGQHYLRIRNRNGADFGAGTSYLLLVASGTGSSGILPTTLAVSVRNANTQEPLSEANVNFEGRSLGTTDSAGIVFATVPDFGNYTVAATRTDFEAQSRSVRVNNNVVSTTLLLSPEQTGEGEGEGEPDGEGEGEGEPNPEPEPKGCGCAPSPHTPGSAGGDVAVMLGLFAALLLSLRRNERRCRLEE